MTATSLGVNIHDPSYASYDSGLSPPITTFNNSAYWGTVVYPDLNPIQAMQLTVDLSADATCQAPCNANPAYRSTSSAGCQGSGAGNGCTGLIAPGEFQIGLRGPDGVYYPLLDRESGAAAQTQAATLCMNFYHNQMPTYCSAPGTPLTFGKMMPAVVGKMLTGTWHVVITRTSSLFIEDPQFLLHSQGRAIVNSYTLTPTTDAPCGVDLRLLGLGLGLADSCPTVGPGHQNGALDPRETGGFSPQIFNNGATAAATTNLALTSGSADLSFNPVAGRPISNIAPGQTVTPGTAISVTSIDAACGNLPVNVVLTGGYSQTFPTTLQEGRPTNTVTNLASAFTDISASNQPAAWLVSNTTGATYNNLVSRYDYTDRCSNPMVDATKWPFFTGSPKTNQSEPYLLGPLFTNRNCTTRTTPTNSTIPPANPVCFYTVNPFLNSLFGFGVSYIHLDTSALNWGIGYDPYCTDANGDSPPSGMDSRLTSANLAGPLTSFSSYRLLFTQAFWTYWDVSFAFDPVLRDNIASVEIASSITDAGTACPLETGTCPLGSLTCRRWCEVFRLQNHSTPYTTFSNVDVTAYTAGASNVQVRFRFQDIGWFQGSTGDLWWALRNIQLQGLGATTISCNLCAPCSSPTFAGIQSAADVSSCADTGVNLGFNNQADQSLWGDCSGGVNCFSVQALRRFDIYRSDAPATVLMSVPWTSASSFTVNDNTGTNGVTYSYRVNAVNGCGLSSDGGASLSARDGLGSVPSGFANNTATDPSACLLGLSVGWSAPSSWGEVGGSRFYTVLRDGVPLSSGSCSGSLTEATLSCIDSSAVAGVSYTYTVSATNSCALSVTTVPGAVATDLVTATPSDFNGVDAVVDPDSCNKTGVQISWNLDTILWNDNDGNVAGRLFRIYRDGLLIGTASAASTSFNDATGASNTSYTYQVTALNGCGTETASSGGVSGLDGDGSQPNFAGLVSALPLTGGGCQVNLSWLPASGCAASVRYNVYRSTNATFTPDTTTLIARCIPSSGSNAFIDQYTLAGQLYYYLVRAENVTSAGGTGACVSGKADSNLNRVGARPNSSVIVVDDGNGTPASITGLWHKVNSSTGWNCGGVLPFPSVTRAYYYGNDNGAPSNSCTFRTGGRNSGQLVLNVGSVNVGQILQFRYQNRGEGATIYDQFTVSYGTSSSGPWTVALSDVTNPLTLVNNTAGWSSASFPFPDAGNYFVRFFFDSMNSSNNNYLGVLIDDVMLVGGSCSTGSAPLEVSPTGAAQPLLITKNGANFDFTFQDLGLVPEDYNLYQGTIESLQTDAYNHQGIGCHIQSPTLSCTGASCTASNLAVGDSNQYFLLTASAPGGEGPAEGGAGWTGPSWAGPSPPSYSPLPCGNNLTQ